MYREIRMQRRSQQLRRATLIEDAFSRLEAASRCRDVYISSSKIEGLGLFAARSFVGGQRLYADQNYYGRVQTIDYQQMKEFKIDVCRLFQVDVNRFALPEGTVDDFMNHSCEPNCGIRDYGDGYEIVALAEIAVNDEICFDYSTYMSEWPHALVCRCGTRSCRKEIGPFESLPSSLRRYYLDQGVVARFIKEQIVPPVSSSDQE